MYVMTVSYIIPSVAYGGIIDIDLIETNVGDIKDKHKYKITITREHEPQRIIELTNIELNTINTAIKEGTFI